MPLLKALSPPAKRNPPSHELRSLCKEEKEKERNKEEYKRHKQSGNEEEKEEASTNSEYCFKVLGRAENDCSLLWTSMKQNLAQLIGTDRK